MAFCGGRALFESSDSVKFCLISEDKKRGEPGASKNYFYSWWIRVKTTFRNILGLKYHLYSHIAPVVYATDSLITLSVRVKGTFRIILYPEGLLCPHMTPSVD